MKWKGGMVMIYDTATSPPSRGAWIEILHIAIKVPPDRSRPPRGGRGLKFCAECLKLII